MGRTNRAVGVVLAGWLAAVPAGLALGDQIDLGVVDTLALDQPRVQFEFRTVADPAGTGSTIGPESPFNSALLDTGAQGLLLGGLAFRDLDGIDPDRFPQAQRSDGSLIFFEEIGVAGTELIELYDPMDFVFAGSDGQALALPAVRAFGKSTLEFGSFAAVIGTPAMVGRVTTVDIRSLASDLVIGVDFSASQPASNGHAYRVALDQLPADPSTGQVQPDDPAPTLAPLPVVSGIVMDTGGQKTRRNLIVDTGGQVTIISRAAALTMGIDPELDKIDELPVGGIGGETLMPIVRIDEMVVPTVEGVDLVLRDLEVGVIDIAGIDGVLGMNVLTDNFLDTLFSPDPDDFGTFETVVFDFTDPGAWEMRLDLNPLFDVVEPTLRGDINGDGFVGAGDLDLLLAVWNQTLGDGEFAAADLNRDGFVGAGDLDLLLAQWNQSLAAEAGVVPEPATLAVLAAGLGVAGRRRRASRSG